MRAALPRRSTASYRCCANSCGMRACEIKGLQWKHVDFEKTRLQIRRSKTPAGWRDPSLNDACLEALRDLWSAAHRMGITEPDHFLFPYSKHNKDLDPTRSMEAW